MTSAPSFRLLPVEATEAMVDAGARVISDHAREGGWTRYATAAQVYRAALSAAPVMAEATGWQPISSAPKDGTQVLVPYPVFRTGNNTMVPDAFKMLIVSWSGHGWDTGFWMLHETPTHWMPIPDPPALNAALAIAAGQLGEKESWE